MTDEYKLEILNYITNNIETTNPNNAEIFLEQESISRSTWLNYIPERWQNFRYEGMVAGNELTTNLTVLYGGYRDNENATYGIITLVDENFNPVKTIYSYSSGTRLRYIQYMKQAEDGTFYFIDDTVYTFSNPQASATSQKRFVMTNNFTIKNQISDDYEVNLRTSYIFGNNFRNFYCKNMFKDENSSHYIFFGNGANDGASNIWAWRNLRITGLKVNVGESNTWTAYVDTQDRMFGSAIATFNGDNVRFRCISNAILANNRTIDCVSKTYTGNVSTATIATFSYAPYVDDYNYKKQSVFLDYDNVYFVQSNQRWGRSGIPNPKHIGLYLYNFTNSVLTEIYHKSLGSYDYCNLEAIYIDRCNTDVYVQYNTNINNNTYADYYFQRLTNNTWNPTLIATQELFFNTTRTMFVKSNFNLLQCYLYSTNPSSTRWFWHLIKEDYNPLNYNGTSYIDYNSLISKKGRIYSNNKVVFARNLYNKVFNNNNTVSTIQIPNNYLNGITLDLKTLLSETDLAICNDTNETSKNIYEMMYINYINSINVIDEDTGAIYPDTATYINTNINTGTKTNYDNSFIGKVKINYGEDTITQLLTWTWNTDHYETAFTIDTTDIPISLEYMSYDETTTYITKPLDLEQNKYYTISQKLRIE